MRRGLVPSRAAARRAILDGRVTVAGTGVLRPASPVDESTLLHVDPAATRFVGRGGHKLEAALAAFSVAVAGRRAVDVGSSTGGFTDCLLQRQVGTVLALDVGTDQLHAELRSDPRVTCREQTDVRDLDVDAEGGAFDLIVVDVSFVSLSVIAGALSALGTRTADWIVLVKPQFEVGPEGRDRRGVVVEESVRRRAVDGACDALAAHGLHRCGMIESPTVGGAGNVEYLLWLRRGADVAVVTPTDDDEQHE